MLLLLLGSCSRPLPVDVIVFDGRLVITTEREWRWFIIPSRPPKRVCGIEVWGGGRYMWRAKSVDLARCATTPFAYGARLPELRDELAARPLVRGETYMIGAWGAGEGYVRFRLTEAGRISRWSDGEFERSPDQVEEERRDEAWVAALVANGMSEEDARGKLMLEGRPGT